MGCSSQQSLQLVENIIRDHFFLNTSNQSALKTLATTAPQFVSNFITAVTELYMHDAQRTKKMPPKNLLEVITSWVRLYLIFVKLINSNSKWRVYIFLFIIQSKIM